MTVVKVNDVPSDQTAAPATETPARTKRKWGSEKQLAHLADIQKIRAEQVAQIRAEKTAQKEAKKRARQEKREASPTPDEVLETAQQDEYEFTLDYDEIASRIWEKMEPRKPPPPEPKTVVSTKPTLRFF